MKLYGVIWIVFGGMALLLWHLPVFADEGPKEEGMNAEPSYFWSRPGQERVIRITGGLPPYRWQSGVGEVDALDEHRFQYRAPNRFGEDFIVFNDRAGQAVKIKIDIFRPLSVSPAKINLPLSGMRKVRVQGGSGAWTIEDAPHLQVKKLDANFIEVYPQDKGMQHIRVRDMLTEDSAVIDVKVYGPLEADISP